MAVYFFYGEEDYNIDLELEKFRSKLNPDFISMSYHILEHPKYEELITALRTPPMMFGNMLIVINAEEYFSENKKWFEDNELEDIENALNNTPEATDIVFVIKIDREEGKRPDSRKKLFKLLSKHNVKEFPLIPTFKTDILSNWINKKAAEKGLTVKSDAMQLFIEQIGNNLRQFDSELDKLKLIAYPQKTITKEMVGQICISNQDLFNITKFITQNRKDKALAEFKKLMDTKYPLEIIVPLQTMIRQWILVKINSNASNQELMNLTGIKSEGRIYNLKKELKDISAKDLIKLKNNLFDIEFRIKKGEVTDIESEVECALIR